MNSIAGDHRMIQLAVLGEICDDISLEELVSYNGQFPLWKRIAVTFNLLRVSLVFRYLWADHPFKGKGMVCRGSTTLLTKDWGPGEPGGPHRRETDNVGTHLCVPVSFAVERLNLAG